MGGLSEKIRLEPSLSLVNTGFLFYFTGSLTSTGTGVEVQEGQTITFTVTPNAAVNAATTLVLNVTGQALGGVTSTTTAADFETAANVTFAQGETAAKTITLKVAADTATEGREAYAVDVLDTTAYASRSNSVAGVITDALPNLTLTASATSVNEGAAVTYTVTSSVAAPAGGLTIPYTLAGTATSADYTASATGNIVIAAGATTGTLVINATADNATEGAETVSVQLGTVNGANVVTTTPVVTTINDTSVALATNAFSLSGAATVDEGATATYTVTRGSAATVATTVPYTITGTAVSGTDFTGSASGTLTFAVGATTATISLPITADLATEGNETIIVTLGTPSNATDIITTGAGTVTTTVADTSVAAAVSAFTLTASNNTTTNGIDNVTGTTYNTINGLIDMSSSATAPGTSSTWNLTDTIAPTASANAAMNLTIINDGATGASGSPSTATAVSLAGYTASGLKTFNLKVVDTSGTTVNSTTFDLSSVTGLTTVGVADSSTITPNPTTNGADTVALNTIPSGATLSVSNNGQYTNVSGTWATAATQGSADTVNLTLAGRNGAVTVGTGFETAAITTSSSDVRVASLTGSTFKTVTVAGSGLKVDGVMDSTITSFDASNSSGTVNVYLAPGSVLTSAKGGSGTADTLAVNSLPSTLATISGFERLQVEASGTYSLTNATTVNTLIVDATVSGTIAPDFTNATATQNTILVSGAEQRTTAASTTNNLATGAISYALATSTGTSDALTLTLNNGGVASTSTTSGTLTLGGLTANAIENVTLNVADFKAIDLGGLTAAPSGAAAFTLTAPATSAKLTLGTLAITHGSAATTADIINLGAVTGATSATITTDTGSLTFTGGTGIDTVTQNAAVASGSTHTFNLGAGNDAVTLSNALTGTTGNLVINTEAGDDSITLSASVVTGAGVTINGGDGTDTIKTEATNNAAAFIDSLVGVEKFFSIGSGTTTIAGSSTAANNSLEITQIGSGITAFTATSGQAVSIAGVTAVGTITNATLTLTGSTGAETLTGSSTVGTAITGGTGADTMTGGSGADKFIVLTADTATATATNIAASATLGAAESFSTVGMDILNSFTAGDTVQLYDTGTTAPVTTAAGTALITNAGTWGAATAGDVGLIKGTYSSSANTFTAGASGTDSALIWDNNGTTAGGAYKAIILVGYVDAGTTDTMHASNGLFTAVA